MSENFGVGVSFVSDPSGYNYDTVVFQKGKPPLDTELNLVQQIQNDLAHKRLENLSSGWLSFKPFYTDSTFSNSFYTQDPSNATPEYALVNGMPIYVTGTGTSKANTNIVSLPAGPSNESQVNGVFLEVWRALLNPTTTTVGNTDIQVKPNPVMAVDSLNDVYAANDNVAWAVGENGLILYTENAGETWNVQSVNTKQTLRSVSFINGTIGWVVGDNGVIVRTSNAGQIWTLLTSGLTTNFYGIFAFSQQLAWVVGENGVILKTLNGINWLPQNPGITANLRSVYFIDVQTGWVCGDNGTILRTNDAGTNWMAQPSGITNQLNAIYFYDARTGFAVGNNGLILATSNGGTTWFQATSNTTQDLSDVTMAPALDEPAVEDVTSQFNGSNKTCVLSHNPITKGNGNGTVTNLPSDVTVTVNGLKVAVDTVDGTNGIIVLNQAPVRCAAVLVTYNYKISTAIFRGKAWVTGKFGTVLESNDIGNTWTVQDPLTSYNINAIKMTSPTNGWIIGEFSKIRHTVQSGLTWVEQLPDILARQVQRVFNEGNVESNIYLNDNSLHPDVMIETTERIQVQYRIRVESDVDPFSYPDSGLSSASILGHGPDTSGTDYFVNMGPVTGDFGLWRAQCNGTVDGYTYAIPMFLVGRRNTGDFNAQTNANGSNSSLAVRPDLLTSANIVATDILDARRKVLVPSTSELLGDSFEALMNNSLSTRFFRDTVGGDRYGVEVLQVDSAGDSTSNLRVALSDVAGGLSSTVSLIPTPQTIPYVITATNTVPDGFSNTLTTGVFHQNPVYTSAVYASFNTLYDGQSVPGTFSGLGTNTLDFTFSAFANTQNQDSDLINYVIKSTIIQTDSTASLSRVPSNPQLVNNTSSAGTYYYNGVFENETTGRVISQWSSGITGYENYVLTYPISSDNSSQLLCSPVEVHLYVKADSSSPSTLIVNTSDFQYPVQTISQVKNITSGYSYKIHNVSYTATQTIITAEAGYSFVSGSIYEIVGQALTVKNAVSTGASVNFKQAEKKLSTFCVSEMLTGTLNPAGSTTLVLAYQGTLNPVVAGNILGVSSMERVPMYGETGIILPICWINGIIYPISIKENRLISIKFQIYNWDGSPYTVAGSVSIQVLVNQTSLFYTEATVGITSSKLQVGYYYKAYQSVSDLPVKLSIKIVERSQNIVISDLGTGGSLLVKEPFDIPLQNIPVNDLSITDDNIFFNIEPMKFSNFSVDGGYAQMPTLVPGNLNGVLELSNPTQDALGRFFYKTCSKSFIFRTEGLQAAAPRKIFNGVLAQVVDSSDEKFIKNEYVLIVFSRSDLTGTDNFIEYGDKSVIAVYRLPNRPLVRK